MRFTVCHKKSVFVDVKIAKKQTRSLSIFVSIKEMLILKIIDMGDSAFF